MPLYNMGGNTAQAGICPFGSFTPNGPGPTIYPMENPAHTRPIHGVRWRNFRRLLDDRRLTITDVAAKLKKAQGQVSHFGGKRPSKVIGDQIASEIEEAFSLPPGSLDLSNSGEGTANELSSGSLSVSQFREPDEATLAEVEVWLGFEEGALGRYQPVTRLRRSIAILQLLQADGGRLTPAHAADLIDAVRRQQGAGNDGRAASTGDGSGRR